MILYVFYYPQISSTKRRLPASILSHFAGLELTRHGVDCSRSSAHILTGISLSLVGLLSKVRFFCQNWTSTVAMRSLHKFCVRLWLSLATSGTRYPAIKLFPAVSSCFQLSFHLLSNLAGGCPVLCSLCHFVKLRLDGFLVPHDEEVRMVCLESVIFGCSCHLVPQKVMMRSVARACSWTGEGSFARWWGKLMVIKDRMRRMNTAIELH